MRTPRRSTRLRGVLGVAGVLIAGVGGLAVYAYVRYLAVDRYGAVGGDLTVEAHTVTGLGSALVTNTGYALYTFPPDDRRRVTCTGGCATAWPPLVVPTGARLVAGDGVEPRLLGTVPGPGGGRVVTYHGWPLYTYLGDADPFKAAGQATDADGGYWYILRPSGQVVTAQG